MKALKIALITASALFGIFLSGYLFIPKNFFVQRSVFSSVSDTAAFKYAANYKLFNTWNPFFEKEPHANYSIKGTPDLAGYSFSWNGKTVGKGNFEFIGQEPYRAIYQKLTFNSPWNGSFIDNMYFAKTYKGIIITWTFSGENKSLLDRWKSLFYDNMVGDDYQRGLDKLKEELEKEALANQQLSERKSASL